MACRGSGNPATLAWIAEALELGPTTTVVDIGAGLGGPGAWLNARYGCTVFAVDPVHNGSRCAKHVFELSGVVATGTHLPLGDDAVYCALVLGVISVVPDPMGLLREARRVARHLSVLAYLSTTDTTVRCGGSTFVPLTTLLTQLSEAGWLVDTEPTAATMHAPPTWNEAEPADRPDPNEAAVGRALAAGEIEPHIVVARR